MLRREISAEEVETYTRDGIVCLRGLFDTDWVEAMRDAAAVSLSNPSEMAIEMAEARGDDGRYFFDTFVWRSNPACRRFVFESPAAEVAGRIMGSTRVNLFFDQWLIKEPGTATATPWHHDLPYWPVQGDDFCSLWLALDPIDLQTGAVEYVKGSHRWGTRYFPDTFSGMEGMTEDLPRVPDIDAARDDHDVIHFDLEPGDCTVHHGLLVHGAPGNHSPQIRRRAYVTRWAGDDATFDARDGVAHMPELPPLAHGAALDSDLWPLVWSSAVSDGGGGSPAPLHGSASTQPPSSPSSASS